MRDRAHSTKKWSPVVAGLYGGAYVISVKLAPQFATSIELIALTIGAALVFKYEFGDGVKERASGARLEGAIYLALHAVVLYGMWSASPLPFMAVFPILFVEHIAGMVIMMLCTSERIH